MIGIRNGPAGADGPLNQTYCAYLITISWKRTERRKSGGRTEILNLQTKKCGLVMPLKITDIPISIDFKCPIQRTPDFSADTKYFQQSLRSTQNMVAVRNGTCQNIRKSKVGPHTHAHTKNTPVVVWSNALEIKSNFHAPLYPRAMPKTA